MELNFKAFSKTEALDHQTLSFVRWGERHSLVMLVLICGLYLALWAWLGIWWGVLLGTSLLVAIVIVGPPRVNITLRPKSLQVSWRTNLLTHSQAQIALAGLADVRVTDGLLSSQLHLVQRNGETRTVRVGDSLQHLEHLQRLATDILERRDLCLATKASGGPEADRRALQALGRQAQGQW